MTAFNNDTHTIHSLPVPQQKLILRYADKLPAAARNDYIGDVLARLGVCPGIAAVEAACATTTVYGGQHKETNQ